MSYKLAGVENSQVFVVSEWERRWSLISISFDIDSSVGFSPDLQEWYRKLSPTKPNMVMEYNLLAGKN